MTTDQLDKIIAECPDRIRIALGELHQRIREACAASLEETQDGDKSAKISVPISLKIDLSQSPPAWNVTAGVSVKFKSVSEVLQSE
jgi:hypothetical protein